MNANNTVHKLYPYEADKTIRCSNCRAILGYRLTNDAPFNVIESFVHGDTDDLSSLQRDGNNYLVIGCEFDLIVNHKRGGQWTWIYHGLHEDEGFVILSSVFGQICKAIKHGLEQEDVIYLSGKNI